MFITCPTNNTPIKVGDLYKAIDQAFEYSQYELEDRTSGVNIKERKSYWNNIYEQLQSLSEEKIYIHNEHNVALNPDTIFKYKNKEALAWCYWEIDIARCKDSLWDFGYWIPGGSSPCCIGRFKTKEEAFDEAVNFLKEHFKKGYKGEGLYSKRLFLKAKKEFTRWRNQKMYEKPSQTSHLVSVPDTGSNYVQTSLF